jgi:hypothetical protein
MPFLELPLDKLKNKVVCDLHFKEIHFMNYKREKLNKTNSVSILKLPVNKTRFQRMNPSGSDTLR